MLTIFLLMYIKNIEMYIIQCTIISFKIVMSILKKTDVSSKSTETHLRHFVASRGFYQFVVLISIRVVTETRNHHHHCQMLCHFSTISERLWWADTHLLSQYLVNLVTFFVILGQQLMQKYTVQCFYITNLEKYVNLEFYYNPKYPKKGISLYAVS